MKNFIAGILIFALGVVASWAFFSATASVQEEREIAAQTECDRQLAHCGTGQHCIVKGRQLLTITAKGAH